jgi:phosphatidylinositol glycan class K
MDENTNVFLYLTGHGGDTFFKFRDYEEITTQDLIHTFTDMRLSQRFHELLFVSDTCQAYTLSPNYQQQQQQQQLITPNIYSIASSLKGQYSYSHHSDGQVGVSVVDRFSFEFVQFMNQRSRWKNMHAISLKRAFVESMYSHQRSITDSDVGWDDVGCERKLDQVPLSDFLVMRQQNDNHGALNEFGDLIMDEGGFMVL